MPSRAFILALLAVFVSGSAAQAEDWKIAAVEGDAMIFRLGAWTKLNLGDVISDDSVFRTPADGSMRLVRDDDAIALLSDTEIQIVAGGDQRYTTVRQHSGTVGVRTNFENGDHFAVRTPFTTVTAKAAIFGVHTEVGASSVFIAHGAAEVTEIAHNVKADVRKEQSAKVSPTHGVIVGAKDAPDPGVAATILGADAAGVDFPDTQAALMDTASNVVTDVHASSSDESSGAMHVAGFDEESAGRAEANGHFDLRTVSWVEGRGGRAIMTPLFQIAFGLRGKDAAIFWPCVLFACASIGYLIQIKFKDMAFGGLTNTFVALGAACGGVLFRDGVLVDASFIDYEPLLTLGLVSASIFISMLGLRFVSGQIR